MVLIHAPAGYGKSTLAAQWVEDLTRQRVNVAWLAIDSDDNNTVWFLAHLIEAVRRSMPDLADALQQEFEGRLENTESYVLNALINRLHSDKQTLALVMEDWHRVDSRATKDALAALVVGERGRQSAANLFGDAGRKQEIQEIRLQGI